MLQLGHLALSGSTGDTGASEAEAPWDYCGLDGTILPALSSAVATRPRP